MNYAGIDLHRLTLVVAVEDENGTKGKPRTISCRDTARIRAYFEGLRPFTAVIEAMGSSRWLFDMLRPLGKIVLAHPFKLKAITSGRAKTDKLDAAMLAKLLRADLIPRAHVPDDSYGNLRDLTRARASISQHMTQAKNELHALLAKANCHVPYKTPFGKGWTRYVRELPLGAGADVSRDEILARIEHYEGRLARMDEALEETARGFPQIEAIRDIHGVGPYLGLLIVAEIAEPWRFSDAGKVGAYAGLTPRVNQSGEHCYHGRISKQGSTWLRWALVQVAMFAVRRDEGLRNLHERIRKRSSAAKARVAVARKLAEICWKRLMEWHRSNTPELMMAS
jgi:transposase